LCQLVFGDHLVIGDVCRCAASGRGGLQELGDRDGIPACGAFAAGADAAGLCG